MAQVGPAPAGYIPLTVLVGAIGGAKAEGGFKVEPQGVLTKGLLNPETDPGVRRGVVDQAVVVIDAIVEGLEGWVKLTIPTEAAAVVIGVGGARKCRGCQQSGGNRRAAAQYKFGAHGSESLD